VLDRTADISAAIADATSSDLPHSARGPVSPACARCTNSMKHRGPKWARKADRQGAM